MAHFLIIGNLLFGIVMILTGNFQVAITNAMVAGFLLTTLK